MGTGFGGTYVLTIDQTSLDGTPATTGFAPQVGQVWRRQGEAIRIDGQQSTLLLENSLVQEQMRARVAKAVQRRFDLPDAAQGRPGLKEDMADAVVVTDGCARFTLVPIVGDQHRQTLLWCPDGVPSNGTDYKVAHVPDNQMQTKRNGDQGGDVICFTAGTRIRMQEGVKQVDALEPGDFVQTKDNGCQELLWVGKRHMTGARLHALPDLRPIRIRSSAMQAGIPDDDLLISPHHRMLYSGKNAHALYNAPEVLISAQDMINDRSVFVDHSVKEVTYFHLLFAEHQIVWANGVPTESYHPANTTLDTLERGQRDGLLSLFPELGDDLHHYGPHVRRNLTKAEAAILRYNQH